MLQRPKAFGDSLVAREPAIRQTGRPAGRESRAAQLAFSALVISLFGSDSLGTVLVVFVSHRDVAEHRSRG